MRPLRTTFANPSGTPSRIAVPQSGPITSNPLRSARRLSSISSARDTLSLNRKTLRPRLSALSASAAAYVPGVEINTRLASGASAKAGTARRAQWSHLLLDEIDLGKGLHAFLARQNMLLHAGGGGHCLARLDEVQDLEMLRPRERCPLRPGKIDAPDDPDTLIDPLEHRCHRPIPGRLRDEAMECLIRLEPVQR